MIHLKFESLSLAQSNDSIENKISPHIHIQNVYVEIFISNNVGQLWGNFGKPNARHNTAFSCIENRILFNINDAYIYIYDL